MKKRDLLASLEAAPSYVVSQLAAPAATPEGQPAGRRREVLFYTGARVERYDWWADEYYDLSFAMEGGDLTELSERGKVLDAHNQWSLSAVLGKIETAEKRKEGYVAGLLFSDREEVDGIWQDVEAGILRDVSMGVKILSLMDATVKADKRRHVMATKWSPYEISLVPFGADPGARFLAADPRLERLRAAEPQPAPPPAPPSREAELALYQLGLRQRRFRVHGR